MTGASCRSAARRRGCQQPAEHQPGRPPSAVTTAYDSGRSVPSGSGGSSRSSSGSVPRGSLLNAFRGPRGSVRLPRGAPPRALSWGDHSSSRTRSSRRAIPLSPTAESRSATGPRSGNSACGSTSSHGPEHEGPLRGARVRQPELVVVAAPVADHDQVDVEGARRVLDLAALPVEGVLDRQRAVQQARGGQRGVGEHHRVEELVGAVGRVDRLGLVDRGDRRSPRRRGCPRARARRPGGCPSARRGWSPTTSTARRIGRISPVSVSASMMFGLGVSVTGGPPGLRPGDRQRDVRERRVDGCIRLVDRDAHPFNTAVQEADLRDPLGERLDQVDRILLDGGFHRRRETSVVDGR